MPSETTIAGPRFVLPGTWWRVDLATPRTTAATIRRIVDEAVGLRDDLVQVRADLRAQIAAAAEPARDRGAVEFYFSREITGGVPLAATLAVFVVRADLAPMEGMPAAAIDMAVADAIGDDGRTAGVGGTKAIRVTRKSYRRQVAEKSGVPAHELLEADYWVSASAPARVAVLSFSTAHAELEDELLLLFDAILGTLRWNV